MSVYEAALWGLLQGLTEFLPVSSSGHLVLVPWLLGLGVPSVTFDVLVHLATLAAVLIFFRAELAMLIKGGIQILATRRVATSEARLAWLVIISSIPAAAAGLLLESVLERAFAVPGAVAVALLITGTVLYLADKSRGTRAIPDLSWKDAAVIGLAQAVALIPGISRSGATMSAGLGRGLTRGEAARYAFVMSIPVVAAAAAKELLDMLTGTIPSDGYGAMAVGMTIAFGSGYLALSVLFRHVQRHGLRVFSIYCWALGLLSLVVLLVRAAWV
ncbi:MAG: undecaprenyl-diphosphate phosphatase [Chloroflexi bacterium]|nr:undecaprenyl-diphosphate phosphatase [Chloroflexota bacterium]